MRKRIVRIWMVIGCLVFGVMTLTGCQLQRVDENKVRDLQYTVCDEGRLPKELIEIIEDRKKEPFKLTYRTKDYLYIVVGYGMQERTDLGVSMTQLYLTENTIFVDTELVATKEPAAKEITTEGEMRTYPYIAVRCPLYEEEVRFK